MSAKNLGAVMALVAGLGMSAGSQAGVIYTYTGNAFNTFTDATPPAGSYTAANRVTGWFELDTALGNNLALASVTGLAGFEFSFTDGRKTVTSSSAGLIINNFQVGTDGSGNIDEWLIAVGIPANPNVLGSQGSNIQSDGEISGSPVRQDRGAVTEVVVAGPPASAAVTLQDSGSIRNTPGTWARTSTVPEPASLALFGLGLAGLGVARWKKLVA